MNKFIMVAVLLLTGSPVFAAITSFTVDGAAVSKSTGASSVSGTIECTAGDTVAITASIISS